MRYAAFTHREGKHTLAEFPDCPGCQTFVKGRTPIAPMAREALLGWLEASFVDPEPRADHIPRRPSSKVRIPRGKRLLWVEVPTELTLKLELLWARVVDGVSLKKLAKSSGLTGKAVRQLQSPDSSPELADFDAAFRAIARRVEVSVERLPEPGLYDVRGIEMARPGHPGALLAESLRAMKLTRDRASEALVIPRSTLDEICAGRAPITADVALSIGKVIGNGPGIWLRIQHAHDLWRVEQRPKQDPSRSRSNRR